MRDTVKSATPRFAMRMLLTVIMPGLRLARITRRLPKTPLMQITLYAATRNHLKKELSVIPVGVAVDAICIEVLVLFVTLLKLESIESILETFFEGKENCFLVDCKACSQCL